ncbi:C40 family peptidase [Gordonibacter urolithinfaciens]|mgnify:FL=1|uniref:Hydrolase Nlp/P60 n=1 Tax=Gordonibacter urolithinfaciens TaxID=1335613 RepID=A0A6N8ID50_9ACTN|nr:C40 family peptidase [Gordonibacter urolithinfaciens]MVM53436.1 hydrolase Nlp/P60 [Gordonibacter urolithinfaciens]MVN13834.1 hydrolase Nlp/P60 [Gordonibacter urolithinfaciens]MVN37354.1 hydrolase Nlp/P60 [Gordonibacter urolithinfaciens]MVN54690.1 hydrolase Nlp/P60 [Gordonibacter urolithinfaciens]MVN59976.1 hydrolase Nlp/P60 [Gordonibacter urolithinfaciens]
MSESARGLDRRTFLTGAAALGAAALLKPALAFAEPTAADKLAEADAVRARIVDMQAQLDVVTEQYYKALDEHAAAQQAVADAQARIDEATAQIAGLQEKLGSRARSMYRTGQSSVLDFIMGAATFEEFAQNWDLLEKLNDNDASLVQQTKDLRAEVEAAKAELERQEQIAAEAAAEAQRIKEDAERSVAELQALLAQLDAEAQALLAQEQEAARQAEIAAARSRSYGYSGTTSPVPSQGSVVDYALSRIGCPYVWGAAGPDTFDCSGLVRWAYLQVGMSLPHQTEALYNAAKARLPVSQAQPGDVLWVGYGDGYNGHVGIACNAGGTHYVHAPTFGARVRDTDGLGWAGFTHALRF